MLSLEPGKSQSEVIPFKSFPERIRITKQEHRKGRNTEYDTQNVYSFPRRSKKSKYIKPKKKKTTKFKYVDSGANKTFENLKCNSCNSQFRIIALHDIQWSVCPHCGGANIDGLRRREEYEFENRIK